MGELMKKLLMLVLAGLFVFGCIEGPTGPQGEKGEQGPAGKDGKDAIVNVRTFTGVIPGTSGGTAGSAGAPMLLFGEDNAWLTFNLPASASPLGNTILLYTGIKYTWANEVAGVVVTMMEFPHRSINQHNGYISANTDGLSYLMTMAAFDFGVVLSREWIAVVMYN